MGLCSIGKISQRFYSPREAISFRSQSHHIRSMYVVLIASATRFTSIVRDNAQRWMIHSSTLSIIPSSIAGWNHLEASLGSVTWKRVLNARFLTSEYSPGPPAHILITICKMEWMEGRKGTWLQFSEPAFEISKAKRMIVRSVTSYPPCNSNFRVDKSDHSSAPWTSGSILRLLLETAFDGHAFNPERILMLRILILGYSIPCRMGRIRYIRIAHARLRYLWAFDRDGGKKCR
jgi:hypothetical protein